jgi:hypothetical protein
LKFIGLDTPSFLMQSHIQAFPTREVKYSNNASISVNNFSEVSRIMNSVSFTHSYEIWYLCCVSELQEQSNAAEHKYDSWNCHLDSQPIYCVQLFRYWGEWLTF